MRLIGGMERRGALGARESSQALTLELSATRFTGDLCSNEGLGPGKSNTEVSRKVVPITSQRVENTGRRSKPPAGWGGMQ
jgi:hypothetical protein